MNVTKALTKYYENKRPHSRGKNKPNQTQFSLSLLRTDKAFQRTPKRRAVELVGNC